MAASIFDDKTEPPTRAMLAAALGAKVAVWDEARAGLAAHAEKLPAEVLRVIDEAPRYAEGRAVRFEIRWKKELPAVLQVAAIKMAN